MVYFGTPVYASTEELKHFGILGMKWGIRRYQNKDGTLTEAGRKRLAKLQAKSEKLQIKGDRLERKANKFGATTTKQESNDNSKNDKSKSQDQSQKLKDGSEDIKYQPSSKNPHGKKSVFSMSDDELKREIDRLELEKKYANYMKELYPKNDAPKDGKKKERYFNGRKVASDILTQGLTNAGKNIAENIAGQTANKIGKSLGLNYPLYTAGKKQEQSKEELEKEIEKLKKQLGKG